jgi:hypothetical protein
VIPCRVEFKTLIFKPINVETIKNSNVLFVFFSASAERKFSYQLILLRSRNRSRKEPHHFGGAGAATIYGSVSGSKPDAIHR